MSKALKFGLAFVALFAVAAGVALYTAFHAAQRVPEFYRQAVAADPSTQHVPRDEFIAETTALASDLHREGRWQHEFTAEQINAWLALELATNYPELLAAGWSEPRVEIERTSGDDRLPLPARLAEHRALADGGCLPARAQRARRARARRPRRHAAGAPGASPRRDLPRRPRAEAAARMAQRRRRPGGAGHFSATARLASARGSPARPSSCSLASWW